MDISEWSVGYQNKSVIGPCYLFFMTVTPDYLYVIGPKDKSLMSTNYYFSFCTWVSHLFCSFANNIYHPSLWD